MKLHNIRSRQDVITQLNAQGYGVESEIDGVLTMTKGKPVTHSLHIILSILTMGGWLLFYIPILLVGGIRRVVITETSDRIIVRKIPRQA